MSRQEELSQRRAFVPCLCIILAVLLNNAYEVEAQLQEVVCTALPEGFVPSGEGMTLMSERSVNDKIVLMPVELMAEAPAHRQFHFMCLYITIFFAIALVVCVPFAVFNREFAKQLLFKALARLRIVGRSKPLQTRLRSKLELEVLARPASRPSKAPKLNQKYAKRAVKSAEPQLKKSSSEKAAAKMVEKKTTRVSKERSAEHLDIVPVSLPTLQQTYDLTEEVAAPVIPEQLELASLCEAEMAAHDDMMCKSSQFNDTSSETSDSTEASSGEDSAIMTEEERFMRQLGWSPSESDEDENEGLTKEEMEEFMAHVQTLQAKGVTLNKKINLPSQFSQSL